VEDAITTIQLFLSPSSSLRVEFDHFRVHSFVFVSIQFIYSFIVSLSVLEEVFSFFFALREPRIILDVFLGLDSFWLRFIKNVSVSSGHLAL
jgi:hypothetical protein